MLLSKEGFWCGWNMQKYNPSNFKWHFEWEGQRESIQEHECIFICKLSLGGQKWKLHLLRQALQHLQSVYWSLLESFKKVVYFVTLGVPMCACSFSWIAFSPATPIMHRGRGFIWNIKKFLVSQFFSSWLLKDSKGSAGNLRHKDQSWQTLEKDGQRGFLDQQASRNEAKLPEGRTEKTSFANHPDRHIDRLIDQFSHKALGNYVG